MATEQVENQPKNNRERLMERFANRYPDRSFEDDEVLMGQINDDYDRYDNELSGYQEREGAFSNMFLQDPRSARMMMEWKNGGDPAIALVRIYGDDILDAINDPEKQEEIKQANKEFAERVAKEQEYEQQYDENLQQSLEMLNNLKQERGYTDEQIDGAMGLIMQLCKDAMLGKFTPDTVEMAMKAMNYDADMADAQMQGEVRGKNAKIQEQLRRTGDGDGVPQMNGSNSRPGGQPMPQLGALDRYDGMSKNIWDRGNERRIVNR